MQPFYRRLHRVALTATALVMLGGCYYYPGYGYYPGYYHPGYAQPGYYSQPGNVVYDNGTGATTTPAPDSGYDGATAPPTTATPGYNSYYYGPGYYYGGAPYYAGYGYPPPYYYGYGYPYYGYGWGWPFAVGLSFGYYGGHGGHYHGGGYHGGGGHHGH